MCREQELESASLVDGGGRDFKVEDCAEVVWCYEGGMGWPESGVRELGGDGYHECWTERARG